MGGDVFKACLVMSNWLYKELKWPPSSKIHSILIRNYYFIDRADFYWLGEKKKIVHEGNQDPDFPKCYREQLSVSCLKHPSIN